MLYLERQPVSPFGIHTENALLLIRMEVAEIVQTS